MWKAFNSLFPWNTPPSEILPSAALDELETCSSAELRSASVGGCYWAPSRSRLSTQSRKCGHSCRMASMPTALAARVPSRTLL